MLEDAGDHRQRRGSELTARVGHDVVAAALHGEVHVEAASALVVEGLAHEGGKEALTVRDVLDRRLEDEGPVG